MSRSAGLYNVLRRQKFIDVSITVWVLRKVSIPALPGYSLRSQRPALRSAAGAPTVAESKYAAARLPPIVLPKPASVITPARTYRHGSDVATEPGVTITIENIEPINISTLYSATRQYSQAVVRRLPDPENFADVFPYRRAAKYRQL